MWIMIHANILYIHVYHFIFFKMKKLKYKYLCTPKLMLLKQNSGIWHSFILCTLLWSVRQAVCLLFNLTCSGVCSQCIFFLQKLSNFFNPKINDTFSYICTEKNMLYVVRCTRSLWKTFNVNESQKSRYIIKKTISDWAMSTCIALW